MCATINILPYAWTNDGKKGSGKWRDWVGLATFQFNPFSYSGGFCLLLPKLNTAVMSKRFQDTYVEKHLPCVRRCEMRSHGKRMRNSMFSTFYWFKGNFLLSHGGIMFRICFVWVVVSLASILFTWIHQNIDLLLFIFFNLSTFFAFHLDSKW